MSKAHTHQLHVGMFKAFGCHKVCSPGGFIWSDGILLHQVKRPLVYYGRFLPKSNAQLQGRRLVGLATTTANIRRRLWGGVGFHLGYEDFFE